jgi:protein tyrosine/serine phosphatase
MADASVPAPGHLAIDGCVNFRDAGGWPTGDGRRMRAGRLYRSDDPVRTTSEGRAAVLALGLSRTIDLRQLSQVERGPGFLPPEQTFHRPLVDRVINLQDPPPMTEPVHMADLYVEMLERSERELADVLDLIAEGLADGPVLVHCVYGKDRTGLVVAAVQAALGVPAADIVEEYARSDEPTHRRYEWVVADPLPDDPPTTAAPRMLFSAPADAMAALTDRLVARHGSLEGWVASLPVRPDTVERLRAELLEP